MPKIDIFLAGPRSCKFLKFFDFLESLLKWWKPPPVDHRTLEMCIFADLDEKYVKMWNAAKWQFVAGPRSWKSLNFSTFWKAFKNDENATSWPQDPWNVHICWFGWEICKNVKCPKMTFFSQVRSHENVQIFRLSGKPLKMMKITTSWPQDPWNVHICWFGWEICKNVKCPKMTICCRSAVMKILKFFDFLESFWKWWKPPPVDHRTLEMCIFADLGEKYAKMCNAQIWLFVAGPRWWKSSNFSTFWKAFKNDGNHHQLTTGPLKCAYSLIWVRNMQKCEMPKSDIFLAGPRSCKSLNSSTFWKAF